MVMSCSACCAQTGGVDVIPAPPLQANGGLLADRVKAANEQAPASEPEANATGVLQLEATAVVETFSVLQATGQKRPEVDPTRDGSFRVDLVKEFSTQELGAMLTVIENRLLVGDIRGGPLADWNEKHPDLPVLRGCQIIDINGVRNDTDEMLSAGQACDTLSMLVLPPTPEMLNTLKKFSVPFTMKLRRSSAKEPTGVILKIVGDRILVDRVEEGLVKEWNSRMPAMAVEAGDEYIEINGVQGSADAMLDAGRAKLDLTILVQPVAPEEDFSIFGTSPRSTAVPPPDEQ
eukprot:NODE_1713_length_1077_cov_335.328767.p2 GENE.NODE_1713_length_1077_cov_335.328767~~NODE_1713_length_1077_cov_335.328767.p2  ORF type:complete len:290 (-),score=60.32 NODE_1713_length_1077_cov_335.328767:21-890(-)